MATWTNNETGEIIKPLELEKRVVGRKTFLKCYMVDFLSVLGVFDTKQVDIFVYIIENTNLSTNLFIGTYSEISKNIKVSEPTIAKVFKKLQENNFITKIRGGLYTINPKILMKGNDRKKEILIRYHEDLKE